jgi:hypothetical protein
MGKKSRNKKGRDKPFVQAVPDELISMGPVRLERFGRFIRYSNRATPEQHAEMLEWAKKTNQETIQELETQIPALQQLIQQYDPVELMHRATYMLIPLFMQHTSESEYRAGESFYLPTVEYVQYLIARTQPNTTGKEPSETGWQELWEKALNILQLTQTYLITRKTLSNPPTVIDQLRSILDGRRLGIRVDRYPFFLPEHLRTSLEPYGPWIEQVYGISATQVIKGLVQIDDYLRMGVIARHIDARQSVEGLQSKLRDKGYAVDPGATPEQIEVTTKALESPEFKQLHAEVEEKARLTFTAAIFDITDLTILPKPILSLLAVKPGEAILTSLTGPDHEDLSPLSTSTLHYKPFLEVNERFYIFYHSGFEDHVTELIEADLFRKRPDDVPAMTKKRSDRLEAEAAAMLASILKPDFAKPNVYYPNPDQDDGLAELDLLLGVDDILFLVEMKAGGFSEAATRGAPKDIEKELSDLIIDGQRQSERAERYIQSATKAPFFDHTGKNVVHIISRAHFRRIFRVIVTRENLGWAGAQIAILSILDPKLSAAQPWHVSIDDLRVVTELFKENELRFAHFLEQRLRASSEAGLSQSDEIDHIGLYNKINSYHELPVEGMNQVTFDSSYLAEIDQYFAQKSAGEMPAIPTQRIPDRMKALVDSLRDSHLPRRFEAASIILSMGARGRNDFEHGLRFLETAIGQGRRMTVRLPFTDQSVGLTVTYAADSNWRDELIRSAAQMEQSGCERWIAIQLESAAQTVRNVERLLPGRFAESQMATARAYLNRRTAEAIQEKRPDRNDPCPCGSRKKFKKCHGS